MAMNSSELPEAIVLAQRIRHEIEELTREHKQALERATFVGLTSDEARALDQRRETITSLLRELKLLQGAE